MLNLSQGKPLVFYRVVVIGDGGTGEVRVRNLSRQFAEAVAKALADTTTVFIQPQAGIESVEMDE